jgi:nucleoside-diphosphate-sugar epimerase
MAWEYYTRAKIAAEKLVHRYHQNKWVEAGIIRPGWIYGPRDRASFPRLVEFLKRGPRFLIGSGENCLHLVYAGNVAEACILAGTKEIALGRTYNASNDCRVTQQQYFNAVTHALELEPVTKRLPVSVATSVATLVEVGARLFQKKDPPPITRYGVCVITSNAIFDSSRARKELGWTAAVGFEEGLANTLAWYKSNYDS